jgi:hypothetical protein
MAEELSLEETLLGLHQDLVLELYNRPYRITTVGRDANGLIVNWHYKKFKLTLSRFTGKEPVHGKEVTAYFVTKVEMKGIKNDKPGRKRHRRKQVGLSN